MTSDERHRAALAFWRDENAGDEQAQAALLIAQRKNFRPKTVVSLDEQRKARFTASLGSLPEVVAARALVAYHFAERRPMMEAFLDALGIAHEDGVIQEDIVVPDPATLTAAAAAIAERFPAAEVWLYLNTLVCQDPATWGNLRGAVDTLVPSPSGA